MRQQIRRVLRFATIPLTIAAFLAGLWGWSFWWFVALAAVSGVAFADQRLTVNDPLDMRNFIAGRRRNDILAGVFAFGGALMGFGLTYLLGGFFT